jgi:flagellar M-ring protein FliF
MPIAISDNTTIATSNNAIGTRFESEVTFAWMMGYSQREYHRSTDTAPGGVKRMTVAVVLDSKTAAGLNPTRIQNLIANAVGLDPARGDTVQVDNLPFDTTAADAANKELAAAAKAARNTQYLEIGKKSAIALLILIVLFVVLRRRKKDADTVIDVTADDLPNNGMLMNVGQPAAIGGGPGEQLAIAAESEKTRNKMKDDVTALVDNQPDDVAEMLQGWLAERKS